MGIAEFAAARLDEDEAAAKAAAEVDEPPWHAEPANPAEYADLMNGRGGWIAYHEGVLTTLVAQHIARHDPARELREVEVKRKILALHRAEQWNIDDQPADIHCAECTTDDDLYKPQLYPCGTTRLIAAAWSDHPDYDASWSPGE
jgi:Family of unknown function (DUF6221)